MRGAGYGYVALAVGGVLSILFFVATSFGMQWWEKWYYREAQTIAEDASSFELLTERFVALAHEKGAPYAFEVARRAVFPPNTDVHLLGHEIGAVLYEQEGVDGVGKCTQDFRNACSHAIVIGALSEFGEEALPLVRDACLRAPGGSGAYTMCYHGLGHGVFAFFEYDLEKTIAFCRQVGTDGYHHREYVECVGGAIMELAGGGGHSPRAWEEARDRYFTSALSPCTSALMPDDAKEVCLSYLTPRLWEQVGITLGAPDPALFDEAFALCERLPKKEPSLREACFRSFGKEFLGIVTLRDVRDSVVYDAKKLRTVLTWCRAAGSAEGVSGCISDVAATLFWGGEKNPDDVFRFCELTSPLREQEACYIALAEEMALYTRGAMQKALCERFPDAYRTLCMTPATL